MPAGALRDDESSVSTPVDSCVSASRVPVSQVPRPLRRLTARTRVYTHARARARADPSRDACACAVRVKGPLT